jgi:hypothetical protein
MARLFDDEARIPAGGIVITVGGVLLLLSAATKFAHSSAITTQLNAFGFNNIKLTYIAVLETISALLLLAPATRSIGLLLVCSYMGGAVATHVQHNHSFLQPAAVLFSLWFGTWLRHPEVLWSLRENQTGRSPAASFMPTKEVA